MWFSFITQIRGAICIPYVLRGKNVQILAHSWDGATSRFIHQHSTEGDTYIRRAAITLGIGPHSSCFIFTSSVETGFVLF